MVVGLPGSGARANQRQQEQPDCKCLLSRQNGWEAHCDDGFPGPRDGGNGLRGLSLMNEFKKSQEPRETGTTSLTRKEGAMNEL